jgi:hypothetical protein
MAFLVSAAAIQQEKNDLLLLLSVEEISCSVLIPQPRYRFFSKHLDSGS